MGKNRSSSKIIIVDDFLGQDEFMADIYKMAAPSGVEVVILTAEDAGQAFQNNTLGDKIYLFYLKMLIWQIRLIKLDLNMKRFN